MTPLVDLEKTAHRTRRASCLVAIALLVVGVFSMADGLNPTGIALLIAAGTVTQTSATLTLITNALCDLHDDLVLDHDIISCQQEVIAALRQGRP